MKVYKMNSQDEEMFIINESEIETADKCKTYDMHGQQIGCWDAGCYCFDNSNSGFQTDLIDYICEQFNKLSEYLDLLKDIKNCGNLGEFIQELEEKCFELEIQNLNFKEIERKAENWITKNEQHTEIECFQYHDGHNWRSIEVTDKDHGMLEVDQNDEIMEEYSKAEFSKWENGFSTGRSKNGKYLFTKSQWQGSFEIAMVQDVV